MEKYKVFLGSDIAKTYSDAKNLPGNGLIRFQIILISYYFKE